MNNLQKHLVKMVDIESIIHEINRKKYKINELFYYLLNIFKKNIFI